jgi:hypothetical protein
MNKNWENKNVRPKSMGQNKSISNTWKGAII